jgi:hypothetical protein
MRPGVVGLALLALAGCGGGEDAGTLVEYSGTSNGILAWHYEMRVRDDGWVSASSDHPAGCPAGPAEVRLEPAAIRRLRAALHAARLGERKWQIEPGVNAQELEIRSGGDTYRLVGRRPAHPDVEPLIDELDRVRAWACGISDPGGP